MINATEDPTQVPYPTAETSEVVMIYVWFTAGVILAGVVFMIITICYCKLCKPDVIEKNADEVVPLATMNSSDDVETGSTLLTGGTFKTWKLTNSDRTISQRFSDASDPFGETMTLAITVPSRKHFTLRKLTNGRTWKELIDEGVLSPKLHHKYILAMNGLLEENNTSYLVLSDISDSTSVYCKLNQINDDKAQSIKMRLKLAYQISDGMQYLHTNDILHGNLTTRTCLLINDEVKIFGIGESLKKEPHKRDVRREDKWFLQGIINDSWPYQYLATEILTNNHSKYTRQADMWSFGVVLWEIMQTHHEANLPYKGMNLNEVRQQHHEGQRLGCFTNKDKHIDYDTLYARICNGCWNAEASKRDLFVDWRYFLRVLHTDVDNKASTSGNRNLIGNMLPLQVGDALFQDAILGDGEGLLPIDEINRQLMALA